MLLANLVPPLSAGDQILEWNGVVLSGKSYEEVQHVVAQPAAEIELVVRVLVAVSGRWSVSIALFGRWSVTLAALSVR